MKKLVGIMYGILLIIIVVTIVTGNFNATVIKIEGLLFIAITIISRFLAGNASNNQSE